MTQVQLGPTSHRLRVVVLLSGAGSTARAVLDAADGTAPFEVVAVVADRPAEGLDHAATRGLPTALVAPADHADRAAWDAALAQVVAVHRPDLVLSAGFMRLLGPAFLERWGGLTLNCHPALLPSFPGAHGVRDALEHGVAVTGCTLHLVDAGTDTGPILDQRAVRVEPGDDEATLHERIKVAERELLVTTLTRIATGGVTLHDRKATWA
ncbi:phosphoribosylglycinamide formyltransferase [Kytococcus sedentarius]|uniref:Phosphoribosylglycinamide formyltransferase n=1 Tax=Kytococcus sedentarius (strain ATCC 14392 / DSM 20547 / JCM 11482 / CCUG 33030 / NBRC 15357 / NCTC 11040 / CCM 314 / 541) TaxID=478801 RepID=C7NF12_KYTSD|nr:phosphoribosylglycinamide formyltransferase [Kytococcus sedentarius]ACV05836.1 phosphoribosylglycinamide formyltransferase, formyltetrahydrofolate-dependent [Kytococcus sedentarius DSM 20547]QQB64239.1 phosphoribosylglycinamide formyltransferase [Kytococcus sedentarius]STX12750.1 Phosphoribosylglycinamide formyltransferase [Kytococcus sedentarius]